MSDSSITLSDYHQACLVFAARYAHKRGTGCAYLAISAFKEQWSKLDTQTKNQLIKESNEAEANKEEWAESRKWAESQNTT